MARGEQIIRHWQILRMLQTRGEGLALKDLAAECGVSERTLQRDFEALEEAGFPIRFETDPHGKRYWRLPHDFFRTGPLTLSLTEALSLHLAEDLVEPLAGTLFADGLAAIRDKIRSLIPASALEYFRGADELVYVRRQGRTDYARHADKLRALADACQRGQVVEIRYRGLWRPDEYTTPVDPYGLVLYDADLFLVGRSHRAGEIRIFKLTRIEEVRAGGQRFERPADFALEEHFRNSFGIVHSAIDPVEIVVRFTGPAAALVDERSWHESQRNEWLAPEQLLFEGGEAERGALRATFRLADVVEFKRWIRGFGAEAEVLKPEWLRHELRDELRAAAALYDAPLSAS